MGDIVAIRLGVTRTSLSGSPCLQLQVEGLCGPFRACEDKPAESVLRVLVRRACRRAEPLGVSRSI